MTRLPPRTSIVYRDGRVLFIDQRLLPGRYRVIETGDWRIVAKAIETLAIRGAPLIGVAAALALAAQARPLVGSPDIRKRLAVAIKGLKETRPTAVNLSIALTRMAGCIEKSSNGELASAVENEALAIMNDDRERCDRIAAAGLELIPADANILTICNTGFLATAGVGTALGVIHKAYDAGRVQRVFVLESRPLLQGARLTTWELNQSGIDVTLLVDGATGRLLSKQRVDLAVIGADRIAANGDTANKIGSLPLAYACREFGLPFYVAAPATTFDQSTPNGDGIPIEQRSSEEVTQIASRRIAPKGVTVFNPAFDVVPAHLITAFITDTGISRPPYDFSRDQSNQAGF